MNKYKLKRDFLNEKAGKEFILKDGWGYVYFSLNCIDEIIKDKNISIEPYRYPELFEEIKMPDDEFAKQIHDIVKHDAINELQRLINESRILSKGIESEVFREYVINTASSLEWVINKLNEIKVKR